MHSLLFALPFILGQVVPTPAPVGPVTVIAWDYSGLDSAGNPETLAAFELAAADPSVDLAVNPNATVASSVNIPPAQPYETTLGNLLGSLPATAPANLWVRGIDQAGNVGAWSAPLLVIPDLAAPEAATNLRIEIRITFRN